MLTHCLASSLAGNLLQKLRADGQSLLKGAVFFSGMAPLDSAICEKGELGFLEQPEKHQLISIPTASIWGTHSRVHTQTSLNIDAFCTQEKHIGLVHAAHTSIPGASDEIELVATAQVIRQTVEMAVAAF